MNKQATEKAPELTLERSSKGGFFERALISQLRKIEQGSLRILTPSGNFFIGESSADGIQVEIVVENPVFFRKACLGGSLGVADSYADGDWTSTDLVMLFRLFLQNQEVMDGMEGGWATLLNKIARWGYALSQRNTIKGSRKNIALHYDLGNDFYELMLDPTMTYSCGIFSNPETTLEEASLAKYDRIIDQLEIKPGHHLLEIGCGWGGFAHRLAQRTEARLTATTISERQYQYALERIRTNGWEERITIVKQDYRNLSGQFDRIVSIEMIEAVGHAHLGEFYEFTDMLLAPGGILVGVEVRGRVRSGERVGRGIKGDPRLLWS